MKPDLEKRLRALEFVASDRAVALPDSFYLCTDPPTRKERAALKAAMKEDEDWAVAHGLGDYL